MTDPRITAIRADDLIGLGSCSYIDECYTDEELLAELDEAGIKSPASAVKFFRKAHEIREDYAADIRGW